MLEYYEIENMKQLRAIVDMLVCVSWPCNAAWGY